ncbi:MAG: hypothetical protein WAU68_13030, partial [Vitreimonas sp.]
MQGTFIGRIYPEKSGFTAGATIKSTATLSGKNVSSLIDIKSSVISATMLDEIDADELGTYRNNLQAQLRKFANFAALTSGSYHFVLLETFIDGKSGAQTPLSNREILEEETTPPERHSMQLDFTIIDTPAIARALEAYNNALREHDYTAKYALEAIEAVREFWGEEKWLEMRE